MKALAVVADSIERRKIEELFGRRQLGVRLESDAHAARTAVEDLGASYLLVDLDAAGDPLDLLRHARAGAQPPWAVVLTRQETPSALRAALEAGADDYLMLPIEPRRLQLKLALGERALAARQQRRDAERGCRQAEQRYRTLVETMSEGLFEIDTEGRIRDANAQLGRITGYPMDELIGAHADRLLVDETMLTRLPGGTLLGGVGAEEYSLPLRTKHGEDRWVKLVGSPLAGAESGRLGSIGVVQDITEQRDAEESLRRREEYFRALLENASDLVTIVDREGGILYLSRSSRRILGREAEQLFGSNIVDLVHPDDRTTFRQRLTPPAEAPDQTAGIEVRFAHRDGSWCYLESVFTDLIDNPVLGGIVVTSRPIADRRKIEEALKRQRAFFEQLFQKSPAGIVILDTSGRVVDANAAFVDLFQHEIAQLAGDRLSQIIVPEDLQQETVELEQLVQQGQSVARETRRQRRDGTSVDVSILAFPIALSGRRIGTYAIYTDITERKNAERQLFHDAFHDALTGLPNRTLLSERLERALRRAKRRQDYRFALLFTDLDGFKQINDAHGHAVGDAFLVEVARRLESCLRPGDTTARLGGDEFMLLLEDIKDPSDATRVAERILFSLDQPFAIEGHELRGSGSIGIAFSSPSIRDVDALVRDADMAMYRAKQRGKACYELYDTEMHESAVESR
ncbi:MAG: PAS domain S-box protein, partial [Acidobacteriota bacterium]